MKINYTCIYNYTPSELEDHYQWLTRPPYNRTQKGRVDTKRVLPDGYKNYHCVDVFGEEFVWMNAAFPKEKYIWYLWFESVFLVPEEMLTFLKLKWS